MELHFKGTVGNERCIFYIDRKKKTLELLSSTTGYKRKPTNWKNLFDKGKERIQELKTDRLNDKMFILSIGLNMAKYGYIYDDTLSKE